MLFKSQRINLWPSLAVGTFLIAIAACGQTSAEPATSQTKTAKDGCAIPFPSDVPVPNNLKIERCNESEKMTGFHGRASLSGNVDTQFKQLKAQYTANGYTLYDNSHGKIRSVIFGGKGVRKGEIQLNPKDGYLSVSVNLYPIDMKE